MIQNFNNEIKKLLDLKTLCICDYITLNAPIKKFNLKNKKINNFHCFKLNDVNLYFLKLSNINYDFFYKTNKNDIFSKNQILKKIDCELIYNLNNNHFFYVKKLN